MGAINERMQQIREHLGLSQEKMAKSLDIGTRTYSRYEGGERDIPTSVIGKLAQMGSFDYNWVFTGLGKMIKTSNTVINEPLQPYNNDNYVIDMLNIRAGAGTGVYNYEFEVVDRIVLDSIFFRGQPDLAKLKVIAIDGDSMEPTIRDGDFIIIDETKADKKGGIYALQLDGQLLVKRLQFLMDGTVKIMSDNDRYQTEIYNPKESQVPFQVLGRKVLTIQR